MPMYKNKHHNNEIIIIQNNNCQILSCMIFKLKINQIEYFKLNNYDNNATYYQEYSYK